MGIVRRMLEVEPPWDRRLRSTVIDHRDHRALRDVLISFLEEREHSKAA